MMGWPVRSLVLALPGPSIRILRMVAPHPAGTPRGVKPVFGFDSRATPSLWGETGYRF
jgi:hypothetical protein